MLFLCNMSLTISLMQGKFQTVVVRHWACYSGTFPEDSWIIGSGALDHMTFCSSYFSSYYTPSGFCHGKHYSIK
ncbi:hypothetical protein RIF29_28768 [Crotalaria pallida]|uniref:Uncharacterized protein n=1 Tax=Crotalaria pallida TaxID=3830 RepID=A0AAN9EDD9_CROPI